MYPSLAAEVLANDPPLSTDPIITDEILATRAGCLRFPNEAALYIAELLDNSSSSSSIPIVPPMVIDEFNSWLLGSLQSLQSFPQQSNGIAELTALPEYVLSTSLR